MSGAVQKPQPFLCPIWGTRATLEAGNIGDGAKVNSARAGGRYGISGTAAAVVANFTATDKAKVTTWLVDQRRLGIKLPVVNAETLDEIKARRPLRFSEMRDRFFRLGYATLYRPGAALDVGHGLMQRGDQAEAHIAMIAAWIGAEDAREALALLVILEREGLILFVGQSFAMTAKGLERMEQLAEWGADSRQAFVAMWFGSEMNEPWRIGFAPAIRDAGYEPFRIDGKEHNNKIDDEIVAEIKRSRFLIADFTCGGVVVDGKFEPNPRGGVYYEAGLAHGLGLQVIFTCRADRLEYAHFDTRQFAHIVWKDAADLRVGLYNRIAATLKEAPGAPGRGKGGVDPAPPD